MSSTTTSWDVIVVGGGHNGLVCAAYLGQAGQRVLVLEARSVLGGPCGSFEFFPGHRATFSNSPGSLEGRVVRELDLAGAGLRFLPSDPSVIHHFPGNPFVGWRDPGRIDAWLDALCPGEARRYREFIRSLEDLATRLGISVFEPCEGLEAAASRLSSAADRQLFEQVFYGSLRDILAAHLRSDEAQVLLGLLASNVNFVPPSAPGTAMGLMQRPLALASQRGLAADDFSRMPLRGSTGHPVGGMGAIIDALERRCRALGGELLRQSPVARVLHEDGKACGVQCQDGTEYRAGVVVSAINPKTLFLDLVDDEAVGAPIRSDMARLPMGGSTFKMALALDGLPGIADRPADLAPLQAAACQFRVSPSMAYIEQAIVDGLDGRPSRAPIIWGLIPSVASPSLVPPGRHILSLNIWHAPYELAQGDWQQEKHRFAARCIERLTEFLPDLENHIVDVCCMSPVDCESELGLVNSNATHGEMLTPTLFGPRPHRLANDYRTPLPGLYLTGGGVWPGGYVTGIPGLNTSRAVLQDLASRSRAS